MGEINPNGFNDPGLGMTVTSYVAMPHVPLRLSDAMRLLATTTNRHLWLDTTSMKIQFPHCYSLYIFTDIS